MNNISLYIIPLFILIAILISFLKKKRPYDSFIEGIKEGLALSKDVFPSLLAMMTAVTILRASGLIDDLGNTLASIAPESDIFANIAPMVLFRPLSGSASLSILTNICTKYGADSFACRTSSVIQGSTDTTFYIITLYFTSVGVTKIRHCLKAGLISDAVGVIIAIILSTIFLR